METMNQDNSSGLLTCVLCEEDYEEEGAHFPRLLPCTYTLCEGCIHYLIQNKTLECPLCGKRHEAKNGAKNFPHNQYLLLIIRRRKFGTRDKVPGLEKCEKHGNQLDLFCLECQKPICISCVPIDHTKHKVTEIEEHVKESLNRKVTQLIKDEHDKEGMIFERKKFVTDKVDTCMEEIQKAKEECMKHFDKIIEEVEKQRVDTYLQADTELATIRANSHILNNIHESLNSEDSIRYETIEKNYKLLNEFMQNNKTNLSGTRSFQFPIFTMGGISSMLSKGDISLVFPDYEDPKCTGE